MEKVKRIGLRREKGYLYFLRGGDVYRVRRGEKGGAKVHDGVKTEKGFLYFLDADGDIARAKMQRR